MPIGCLLHDSWRRRSRHDIASLYGHVRGDQDAWRFSTAVRTCADAVQHVAFTRRLGPLHIMEPLEFNLAGHPEIFIVSNVEEGGKAVGLKRAGWGWHSDGEDKAIPNAGSFHRMPRSWAGE
jgi:alpha-ketoglutarate-dependent taurine dioxygenase